MTLRPYQEAAYLAAIDYMRRSLSPCLIEAATGAGKSHVVAAIAAHLHRETGKRVLCLAPSKELVEQNHAKFLQTGNPASIYCASAGSKSLAHPVVFGSPQTVANNVDKFGDQYCCVVVDEAHGITPTVQAIVAAMRDKNPRLRVVGLTATPYRLGSGYIYAIDDSGETVPDEQARDPYFARLVYRITARELIAAGYLTPPTVGEHSASGYDTSALQVDRFGRYTADSVERAFEGMGRLTASIVAEVVALSSGRRGVMFFAATVQHAKEIMASMPPALSEIVTGDTKRKDRERIIRAFKAQQIKYIVNVSVLTTGFDAPHVDVIAILRATESPGLLQQIIGRGLRLDEGKADCLILDYASNVERHFPSGDIFDPEIRAGGSTVKGEGIAAACPLCGYENRFTGRPNPDGFDVDSAGYWLDLAGQRIAVGDGVYMPAHFGRRCMGYQLHNGVEDRCGYRWAHKVCPDCGAENDIAARYCSGCKGELLDPNEKLRIEFAKMKADPYQRTTDRVLGWECRYHKSAAGNDCLRITYTTEYARFDAFYMPNGRDGRSQYLWRDLCAAVLPGADPAPSVDAFLSALNAGRLTMPQTITAERNAGSKFWSVFCHNKPEDRIDEVS